MYKNQENLTQINCSGILSPNTFWKIISEVSDQLDFRHLMIHLTTLSHRCQSDFCVSR